MAIFKPEDRFLKWKYRLSELYILYPGEEPEKIPTERLTSFAIDHDYENNVFPLVRMELVLEASRYYKIIKNKTEVKFKIRIQKYYRELGKRTESILRDYINDTFSLILDDDDFDVDSGFKEERAGGDYSKLEQSDINDLWAVDNKIEFFLFKTDTIRAAKKMVNDVLTNASVTDGISYIISKTGLKNILMAPADNKKTIPELVIPPMTAIGALTFLDCYYGIYQNGSMLYLDLDRNYLFPYNDKCRCWEKQEIRETDIIIPKKNSTFSSDMCTVDPADDSVKINYIVGNNSSITIKNDSVTYDVLAGNDIESVKVYEGEVTQGSSEAPSSDGNLQCNIPNRTENPYFTNTYTQQAESRTIVINDIFADFDVAFLKPNIIYKFIFEDTKLTKKYKGNYRIVYANHTFIKDGRDFAISSNVTFKRMGKPKTS